MEDNNEMNADCWVPAKPTNKQTAYQMGYLAGYLGKPEPDTFNSEEYASGYAAGLKDASRDRSRC